MALAVAKQGSGAARETTVSVSVAFISLGRGFRHSGRTRRFNFRGRRVFRWQPRGVGVVDTKLKCSGDTQKSYLQGHASTFTGTQALRTPGVTCYFLNISTVPPTTFQRAGGCFLLVFQVKMSGRLRRRWAQQTKTKTRPSKNNCETVG